MLNTLQNSLNQNSHFLNQKTLESRVRFHPSPLLRFLAFLMVNSVNINSIVLTLKEKGMEFTAWTLVVRRAPVNRTADAALTGWAADINSSQPYLPPKPTGPTDVHIGTCLYLYAYIGLLL